MIVSDLRYNKFDVRNIAPNSLENQLKPRNQKVFPGTLTILVHSKLACEDTCEASRRPRTKEVFQDSLFLAKPKEEKREENLPEVTKKNQTTEAPAVGNINHQASSDALRSL